MTCLFLDSRKVWVSSLFIEGQLQSLVFQLMTWGSWAKSFAHREHRGGESPSKDWFTSLPQALSFNRDLRVVGTFRVLLALACRLHQLESELYIQRVDEQPSTST